MGKEAPLRAVIRADERLIVCAAVAFADPAINARVWLTNRRWLFVRKSRGQTLVMAIPLARSSLVFEEGSAFPLRLKWIDEAGRECSEAFRSQTLRDTLSMGARGGAVGGATGGVAGIIVSLALDAAVTRGTGTGRIPTKDRRLYAVLAEACKAPDSARPVDLTPGSTGSLSTLGGRLLIGLTLGIFTAIFLALSVFALISYQTRQAYEAAPICGSPPSPDCRLRQPGVVTAYRGGGGRQDTWCDLTISGSDGSIVTAHFHAFNLCAQDFRGQQIVVEFWRGSLTAVTRPGVTTPVSPTEETNNNPEYNWRAGAILAGVYCLLWLMFGSFALVSVRGWLRRRSLLQASARAAGYLR
jgi:hypothetical protein